MCPLDLNLKLDFYEILTDLSVCSIFYLFFILHRSLNTKYYSHNLVTTGIVYIKFCKFRKGALSPPLSAYISILRLWFILHTSYLVDY